jgi:hypothetical protein
VSAEKLKILLLGDHAMLEPGIVLIVWCAGIVTLVVVALLADRASKTPFVVVTVIVVAMILALTAS